MRTDTLSNDAGEAVRRAYFNWLKHKVGFDAMRYDILLQKLMDMTFYWVDWMPRDESRAADGMTLRGMFVDENSAVFSDFSAIDGPCSLLEMLIGLAVRMETDLTQDPEFGDRTGVWFEQMLSDLGLLTCRDDTFCKTWDLNFVSKVGEVFMDRTYNFDGSGAIFPLKNYEDDQRKLEIWSKMNRWLIENLHQN